MSQLAIKVTIAGRVYALKVEAHEEEFVRKAAKTINERLDNYRTHYEVSDPFDLVCMCALQFATQALQQQTQANTDSQVLQEKLQAIDGLLDTLNQPPPSAA